MLHALLPTRSNVTKSNHLAEKTPRVQHNDDRPLAPLARGLGNEKALQTLFLFYNETSKLENFGRLAATCR